MAIFSVFFFFILDHSEFLLAGHLLAVLLSHLFCFSIFPSVRLTMVPNRKKKHRKSSCLMIHILTSSGVSERASEWAQRSAQAKRAVRSKWTSERHEWTRGQTSEWPSTPICILGYSGPQCVFPSVRLFCLFSHFIEFRWSRLFIPWRCGERRVFIGRGNGRDG